MEFDKLVFDNVGCCSEHPWAEMRHENGNVSTVYANADGTYDVVTHAVNFLMRGKERYLTKEAVSERLVLDAA